APAPTERSGLPVDPPLAAAAALCARSAAALRRLRDILGRGAAGALAGHLMGRPHSPAAPPLAAPRRRAFSPAANAQAREREHKRFAFVVHLLATGDMRYFDAILEPFSDEQLDGFRPRTPP